MSLKRGAGEGQSVQQLVNNFENRLNSVKKELPNISNPSKRMTIKKHFKDMNNYQLQIAPLIANAPQDLQDKYERLSGDYEDIKNDTERQIEMLEKQEAQQKQQASQSSNAGGALSQSLIQDESVAMENFNRDTQNIVEDMKAIDEATSILQTKIEEQHEVVVRVDNTIDDSHEQMVQGNQSLNKAQEHQKASNRCLWYILAGVIVFIIVIVIIVLATVLPKKNKSK
ncbi:hypothetical protein TVAG_205530 [Trichomonas vaginalis G3]|uniref:t-SNARE coiled-coil homology domain-containing protein n=1 Tax=Trichomonas vaginalis (strain ATCC PRA-98 / G3) TaxID=412133 RepID=A2FJE2_TRIV3|nr:syntaxin family [Trichomonas vaginalis G3]EAX94955.1 hypothetical protein TVAG_205530 [Trichomonas vaginalis G3]KAI5501507.1 syntaxin family [Trichomonas vaginalis G3]|eukprot:XP_001307885.1 hypothetical protein [Trichomonas vaginalis G3]